jgi:hypothetical protein
MRIGMRCALAKSNWLVRLAACGVIAFSTQVADARIVLAQGEAEELVGHWRTTTLEYIGPRDTHLVLQADGTAGTWQVTASSRSEVTLGQWEIESKTLNISFGERTTSLPFTFHQEQLVFPNIEGRREFWERIE